MVGGQKINKKDKERITKIPSKGNMIMVMIEGEREREGEGEGVGERGSGREWREEHAGKEIASCERD